MSEPTGTVRRWVPRNLRDDGMIEDREIEHYNLDIAQYVLASDYAALAAQAVALATTLEKIGDRMTLRYTVEIERIMKAVLDAHGRKG
jgi:hypothetical protein